MKQDLSPATRRWRARHANAAVMASPPTPRPSAGHARDSGTPVHVRRAVSPADLARVAATRHAAYRYYGSPMADGLLHPEAWDSDPGVTVLLAESSADGRAIGTARLHSSRHAPLPVQASVTLPPHLDGLHLAEAGRLAVRPDPALARPARDALFKACFLYALAHDVDWLVAFARPALVPLYRNLHFVDLFAPGEMHPIRHAGNLPHRVMALSVRDAPALWARRAHPLLGFMTAPQESIRLDVDPVATA